MSDLQTNKQKYYQGVDCEDSIIFYQKTSYQVAFLMNEDATSKIANWEKKIKHSEEGMYYSLPGGVDGTPSYELTFVVDTDRVILLLRSYDRNYIFPGFFTGQEADNLIYLESTACPKYIIEPQLVVLKIEGEVHQSLINWKNWVDEEAFTSRYIYEFYENTTYDRKYITVRDKRTGESLFLDDSEPIPLTRPLA